MAQRKPIPNRDQSELDRSAASEQLREAQRQLWEASRDLPDEERDVVVQDVTDAVDDAIRRRALSLPDAKPEAGAAGGLREAWEAMAAEVRALPPEDQQRFVREVTEAIDGGIRRRVAWLDVTADDDHE